MSATGFEFNVTERYFCQWCASDSEDSVCESWISFQNHVETKHLNIRNKVENCFPKIATIMLPIIAKRSFVCRHCDQELVLDLSLGNEKNTKVLRKHLDVCKNVPKTNVGPAAAASSAPKPDKSSKPTKEGAKSGQHARIRSYKAGHQGRSDSKKDDIYEPEESDGEGSQESEDGDPIPEVEDAESEGSEDEEGEGDYDEEDEDAEEEPEPQPKSKKPKREVSKPTSTKSSKKSTSAVSEKDHKEAMDIVRACARSAAIQMAGIAVPGTKRPLGRGQPAKSSTKVAFNFDESDDDEETPPVNPAKEKQQQKHELKKSTVNIAKKKF